MYESVREMRDNTGLTPAPSILLVDSYTKKHIRERLESRPPRRNYTFIAGPGSAMAMACIEHLIETSLSSADASTRKPGSGKSKNDDANYANYCTSTDQGALLVTCNSEMRHEKNTRVLHFTTLT